MLALLAQKTERVGGFISGFGPLGLEKIGLPFNIDEVMTIFNRIISGTIGLMTVIAGIWFIFSFIMGAIGFLTAGGNQENIQKATQKLTQSLIGLVIVVAAYAIISLMGNILGLDILNPQKLIKVIAPGG